MRQTLLILVAALLAPGCQSAPTPHAAAPPADFTLDDRPLVSADGHRRSLAFDAPYQRTVAAASGYADADDAWWADRNDARAATYAGYVFPTYLYAHTRSIDRVTDFGGEPRPSGSHTTYRGRVLHGVR